MNLKRIIYELSKDNETLLKELITMTFIHGYSHNNKHGIVFNNPWIRKIYNQHPFDINTEAISSNIEHFNKQNFDYPLLKMKMQNATKETLLVYTSKDTGEIIQNLYLGAQFENNPFIRFIFTDKTGFKNYYKSGNL